MAKLRQSAWEAASMMITWAIAGAIVTGALNEAIEPKDPAGFMEFGSILGSFIGFASSLDLKWRKRIKRK